MFNAYSSNQQTIKVNTVSGTLVKNYRKSFFERFHGNSRMANEIFNSIPKINNKPVVVIQCMILSDNCYLAEIMWKKDFEELFQNCGQAIDWSEEE